MTENIKDKLNTYHKDMMATVDNLNIEDLRTETVTLRLGDTLYELVPKKGQPLDIEEQIRKEFEDKLSDKRNKIKDTIKSKMNEVSAMVSSFQDEFERKEKQLKDTLAKAAPMPDVTWEHAKKGLSIVKGNGRGEIIWLLKRTYNPIYLDHMNIEPLYVKKLMTNIYLKITTRDKQIIDVSTHYMNSLEYFEHYHQRRPDCWGNWNYPREYKTIEDIIVIADQAMAVLENINTMSLAQRNPRLLPRLETLRRHVLKDTPTAPSAVKVGTAGIREGLGMATPNDDLWGN